MLELEDLSFTRAKKIRTKKVLPKCIEIDLIFLIQGRVIKSLTYSQDLQRNGRGHLHFPQCYNNKFLGTPWGRSHKYLDYSTAGGTAHDFQSSLGVGMPQGLWYYRHIPLCQKHLYFRVWKEMINTCIGNSAPSPAAPAPEQRASSRPVVSHCKSLTVSLQGKHNQRMLRTAIFHICWKCQNQTELRH